MINISKFQFSPISSNFENDVIIKVCDILITLKNLDLTKISPFHILTFGTTVAYSVVVTCRARPADRLAADDLADYYKIYNQAKEEFEKMGKIKGFEILNLRSLEKIWISHYDMDILTK